jgi:hypothetical protein
LGFLEIDKEMIIRFFSALSYDHRKEIYDYLTLNKETSVWSERLSSVRSEWHRIYHAFSEEFNIRTYLDNCRKMLHENWQYGIPLIEDLLKKENDTEAEQICEETLSSYVIQRTRKPWRPEDSLLINALMYAYEQPDSDIIRLLKEWKPLAEKLGMKNRSDALKFQLITYQSPYEWDKIAKVIQQTDMTSISDLIAQWQDFILTLSFGRGLRYIGESVQNCWLKWLTEAGIDASKDTAWFSKKFHSWLTDLCKDPKEFQAEKMPIYLLTCELSEISDLKKKYPCMTEMVRDGGCKKKELRATLQNWLKRMDVGEHIPLLITCWRENIAKIIPNPADARNSVYDFYALWLGMVNELDPKAYEDILTRWKTEHKRRKNLWKAIEKRGLSI